MELQIEPEATAEERYAITVALERLLAGGGAPDAYTSRWRVAGIREAVEADEEP